MADIDKCIGTNCPHKESCYRFTATPSEHQWYLEPPIKDGKCDMYWGENQMNIYNQLKQIVK